MLSSCGTSSKKESEQSPVLQAVLKKNCSKISQLISEGENINFQTELKVTPLMMAAFRGYENCIDELLAGNANVNLRDEDQRSALYYALTANQVDISQKLIQAGAEVALSDRWNLTPLMLASQKGELKLVQQILESLRKNALQDKLDENGWSALFYAVSSERTQVANMLINYGFPVNSADSKGLTLVHLSIENEDSETLELLIKNKASCKIKDHSGHSALQLAKVKKSSKIMNTLKKCFQKM